MQMMEVAWEVQKNVDFIVASEELEPGNGYPYDTVFAGLKADSTPRDFSRHLVSAIHTAYNGGVYGTQDLTISSIDCAKLPAVKDAIDGLAKTTMAGSFAAEYKQALGLVQKFDTKTNIDLWHLVKLLRERIKAPEFKTAADKLEAALKGLIVANVIVGNGLKNAHGLAIYFPKTAGAFDAEYLTLAFARESLYDEMLKDYFKKSTAAKVITDLKNNDVESLRELVAEAHVGSNACSGEIASFVADKVRFELFSEGNRDAALTQTVSGLLAELKR